MIEGRHGTHHGHHHGHGMRVAAEAPEEQGHLFVHHGVARDVPFKFLALLCRGEFAVIEQIAALNEITLGGQLLNGITAVKQNALITINVGDGRLAGSSRGKAWIEGECVGSSIELADINHIWPQCAFEDGQVLRLSVNRDVSSFQCFGHVGLL